MTPCLSPSRLERLAEHGHGDAEGERHLAECAKCRAAAEELRTNRQFLVEIAAPLRKAFAQPPPERPPAEDALFAGYRRLDVIGHGGQAVVHRAVHEASGRVVAIKVVRFGSVRQRARLAREAQLAATLRHPGIVTVHDCADLPEGGFAIVMELVDGVALDAWASAVRSERATTLLERRRRIARLFVQVCEAVSHAHQNGVLHRDLKPPNVLVDRQNQPRVLDFGVAHAAHSHAPAITRTDEFSGTLAYAAPETLSNSKAPSNTLADVYALGVMLHEAMIGRSPHRVDGSVEMMVRAVVNTDPVRATSDVDGAAIDVDLSVIIVKAVARDPGRRYDSPAALARDLDNWIEGRPIDARRDSLTYLARVFVRRNRLAVAATVAVIVLLAGSVVALAVLYGHAETARGETKLQAAELGNQLFERNLEQALMLAAAERPAPAEVRAWREALAPSSPRAVGKPPRDPDFDALLWTLRQVVARNPCIGATIVGASNANAVVAHIDGGVAIAWDDGTVTRLRCDDLTTTWTTNVGHAGKKQAILLACDRSSGELAATADRRHVVVIDRHGTARPAIKSIDEDIGTSNIRNMAFDHGRLWIDTSDEDVLVVDSATGVIADRVKTFARPPTASFGELRPEILVDVLLGSNEAVAFDLERGVEIGRHALDDATTAERRAMAICSDGQVLMPQRSAVVLWNPRTNGVNPVVPLRVMTMRIMAPERESGTAAMLLAEDGLLHVIDVAKGERVAILSGHPARELFTCVAACVGPETFITAGSSGLVRMWDARPGRWISAHPAHAGSIGRLSFGPDGDQLFTFGRDDPGSVATWDHAEALGNPSVRQLPSDAKSIRAAFSPDGSLIAVDDRRGTPLRALLRRMDEDFTIVAQYATSVSAGPFDFSPDGQRLAGGLGREDPIGPLLGVLDVSTKTWLTMTTGKHGNLRAVRFSADGRFLLWAMNDGRLYVMDAGASSLPPPLQLRGAARAAMFSPDGECLLVGHDDGYVVIHDRKSGAVLATIAAHGASVADAAWSPDGRTIASASSDGEVVLSCARTYRRLASMTTAPVPIQTLIFSPDSNRLLIGDDLGRVVEWDFDFYDVAIARSVEAWIKVLNSDGVETPNAATMQAWARERLR